MSVEDHRRRATEVRVRRARLDDAQALVGLWREVGLDIREGDVARELASVLERDPEIVLVAEDGHGLAGSVFGTWDGRRGWINRLATRPDRRGAGIATRLMEALERALVEKGCRKVNLLIESWNRDVVDYYRRLGYATDELVFMEKHLRAQSHGD